MITEISINEDYVRLSKKKFKRLHDLEKEYKLEYLLKYYNDIYPLMRRSHPNKIIYPNKLNSHLDCFEIAIIDGHQPIYNTLTGNMTYFYHYLPDKPITIFIYLKRSYIEREK